MESQVSPIIEILAASGPWGAVICVAFMFIRESRSTRRMIQNHLEHTYKDHEKMMAQNLGISQALQECVLRLQRSNGKN